MSRKTVLLARLANHDSRCGLCAGLILGFDGNKKTMSRERLLATEPLHPVETLDQIVKVDGEWVHAECARGEGYDVREDQ